MTACTLGMHPLAHLHNCSDYLHAPCASTLPQATHEGDVVSDIDRVTEYGGETSPTCAGYSLPIGPDLWLRRAAR